MKNLMTIVLLLLFSSNLYAQVSGFQGRDSKPAITPAHKEIAASKEEKKIAVQGNQNEARPLPEESKNRSDSLKSNDGNPGKDE